MKIGIIGLGLIGTQRFEVLKKIDGVTKVIIFDPNKDQLQSEQDKIVIVKDINELIKHKPTKVILSTPHNVFLQYIKTLIDEGIEVLVEKPMARRLDEVQIIEQNQQSKKLIKVGYNYRFMPAIDYLIRKAKDGELGEIVAIEMYLGHGGAPQDKNSWKLDLDLCGGGVLLDPGVHLLDLLINGLTFLGKPKLNGVITWKGFWDTGIEEHGVVTGQIGKSLFTLTTSILNWETKFNFKIIGVNGHGEVSGRGRSDGPQTIKLTKRWAWLGDGTNNKDENLSFLNMNKDKSLEFETIAWLNGDDNVCSFNEAKAILEFHQEIINMKSSN
jgi:predicted dehydrogenase